MENMFMHRRTNASVALIGRIVKVYRKESKHRMNPKPRSWTRNVSVRPFDLCNDTHLLNRDGYAEEVAHSLPF